MKWECDKATDRNADVWILNEVDWGVKRTQYREVIRELGETLNMNWAFGVEFLEVDSKQLGTDAFDDGEEQDSRQNLLEEFKVDKDRLRALHGNAVLSRYPIRSARLVPFTIGYDWFKESKIRPLEKGKRKAAILIGEDLAREVRRGQRTTLFVDLDIPEAPGGAAHNRLDTPRESSQAQNSPTAAEGVTEPGARHISSSHSGRRSEHYWI